MSAHEIFCQSPTTYTHTLAGLAISLEHPNALLGPSNHNIFLCKTINSQLPTLHSIFFLCSQTIVLLLFFWLDTWLTTKPLCLSFPCLFSHSVGPFARVANIIRFGLNFNLRDRLTLAASTELVSLLSLLQDFMLSNEQDQRFLKGGLDFSTKRAYEILSQEPQDDLHAKLIWKSRVPSKIKVFAWLVFKGRLNTKAKLAHKSITPNADCPRCSFNHEDTDHLLIACPLAARIWQRLRIQVLANNTSLLWDALVPHGLDDSVWPFILMAILWRIWDAGNAKAFKSLDTHPSLSLKLIGTDLDLWSHRLSKPCDKDVVFSWRSFLSSRSSVPM